MRAHQEGIRAAADVFRAALAEHADDVALRIQIEEGLAWCLHSISGVPAAEGHARTALELAEGLGEPALLAGALSYAGFLQSLRGDSIALATIERAVGLGPAPGWSEILGRPDWIHALLLQWDGELDAARERFQALRQDAANRGDEHSLPSILFQLARVELLTGDWEGARGHAAECQETTLHSGQAGERSYALTIQALVDAHLGLVEPARARIDEGLALARRLGVQPAESELLAALGFLELSLSEARQADRTLTDLTAKVKAFGFGEPALFRFHGDAIEAKLTMGDRRQAEVLLEELEQVGAALQRAWVLAVAGRCRGLLCAVQGDPAAAYRALERALELHQRLGGEPFEHARTLLALGSVQRRDRKSAPPGRRWTAPLRSSSNSGPGSGRAGRWPSWPPGGAGRVNPSRLADFAAPAPGLPSDAAPHRPSDETDAAMRARLTHLINRLRRRRATGSRDACWPPVEPVVPTLRGCPVDPPSR